MSPEPLLLGVNIDHSATLRQARYRSEPASCGGFIEPDPVAVAHIAETHGADSITIHLREDRRHIVDRDVERIRESIATRMNLEMACTGEMLKIATRVGPDSVCLVPENRNEVTTEGGLDCIAGFERVRQTVDSLREARILVSLFIDPEPGQIEKAVETGAEMVELHTGAWARAFVEPDQGANELERLKHAATIARTAGLIVNAGHGINYHNAPTIRTIPELHELNIGHAILSRAILTGMGEAVREMKARLAR